MRPCILLTERKIEGLRSLEDVRAAITGEHSRRLWERLLEKVDQEARSKPLLPSSMFPGRDPDQARHANRDYTVVEASALRVLDAALAGCVSGEPAFRDAALEQMEALFNEALWPEWRDLSHPWVTADLRTGQLSQALALAYDWLNPLLSETQRAFVLEGIDRCGVQRYLKSVKEKAWWIERRTNWQTCIVGGLGIAGMALAGDHPESGRLVDLSLPILRSYLEVYGPEGEFNECVAYASATHYPVLYFSAYQYHTRGKENLLARFPFPETCLWYLYFTSPPERLADFGDTHAGSMPCLSHFAAVAAAARNGILQWAYLNLKGRPDASSLAFELLWYDDGLSPVTPEGSLPRSRAFPAHSGCISSRSDWNPRSTQSVVFSKAGHGSEGHGNHDAGQICIDAFGRSLIVDLGAPPLYPEDFFGPNRYQYYNASVRGHNVLMFDSQETASGEDRRAKILKAEFDEGCGGLWTLDLTGCYDGVRHVRRTVIHLTPRIVAVLDEALLDREQDISLRWHTADRAEPDSSGRFVVSSDRVRLSARIIELTGQKILFHRREHEYRAPFDRGRLGDRFLPVRESYVEGILHSSSCRLLTLFAVFDRGESHGEWVLQDGRWEIELPGCQANVAMTSSSMKVCLREGLADREFPGVGVSPAIARLRGSPGEGRGWRVFLEP